MRIVGKLNDWKAFFKTCLLCAALVKKAPSDHFVILKKVKKKRVLYYVYHMYSTEKKNVLCNSI